MGSGKFADAESVLLAYAARYFSADKKTSHRWAHWLMQWGNRTEAKLPEAAQEFEKLAKGATGGWRLEQWRSKIKLETLDRAIGSPKENEWTTEKLKLVGEFWAEREHLNRDVYRLGPVRHIFSPRFAPPAWYASWQKATKGGLKEGRIAPEA